MAVLLLMRRGGSLARETAADAGNQRRVAIRRPLRICGDLAPLRWQVNDALHAWSPPPVAAAATAAVAAATGTAAASTALAPCPPAPSQPWLSRRSMQPPQPPIPLPPLHVASAAATAQSAFLTYPWPPRKGRAGPYSPRATSFAQITKVCCGTRRTALPAIAGGRAMGRGRVAWLLPGDDLVGSTSPSSSRSVSSVVASRCALPRTLIIPFQNAMSVHAISHHTP